MGSIGILTESIHGLPPELIKKYDIQVVPMGVVFNNKGYRDTVDITAADCYKLLKEIKSPGSTSTPSPGDFVNVFESLARKTDSIIYIGVSKALSATHDIARQAREMFQSDHPGIKIELIDSKNCIGAIGFLVLEAARAAESGKSLTETVEIVQSMIPRVKYLAVLDTLEGLVRIGRMPKSAVSDATANVRPIIGMTDNSGTVQNLTAMPRQMALEKLVELAGKYLAPDKPVHAMVHYSEYRQEAEELKKLVTSRYNCVEFYMSEYTPAALCSTGLMTGLSVYS